MKVVAIRRVAMAVVVFFAIIAACFVALYKQKEIEVDSETGKISVREGS